MKPQHLIISACLIVIASYSAHAQNNPERQALLGIIGVKVVVEELPPDVSFGGLGKEQIVTDVELRLRKAGVRVSEVATPFLYVNVHAVKSETAPLYALNISMQLQRLGTFVGAGKDLKRLDVSAVGTVWSQGILGIVGSKNLEPTIRQQLADITDRFLNDLLAANPR